MSEAPRSAAPPAAQLAAVASMMARSTMNSLRRRQGAGALVIFPLLVAFLVVELARFGGRAAHGMARVLSSVPHERGVHYASFWLLVLSGALVALKYARVVPGRGARKMFDTALLRALPVSAVARTLAELLAAFTYAAGVVALVMVPTLWGLCRQRHDALSSAAITAAVALAVNGVASLAAVALHEAWSRRLAGRALDSARVMAAVAGVGLMGLFTAMGPLGAGIARTLHTGTAVPAWTAWLPTRPVVRWILDGATAEVAVRACALALVPSLASLAVFVWRARDPAELSLDAPWGPSGRGRWEASLTTTRVEMRALVRQAPYLLLAAPTFLAFFALLAKGSRSATGSELPIVVLMGLAGWAVVVMGTALSGAASRRWRRVLWIPTALGRDHRDAIRAVTLANSALVMGLALAPMAVLFRHELPGAWWFARMVSGLAAVLLVGQWTQASAVFLLIDPAPDRLTGLSVGALFGVLATSLPTAALVVMYSATPFAAWAALVALLALLAWSMESAAAARLRWIRDPDGDPDAETRAWPALRTFGLAIMAQTLLVETLSSVAHASLAVSLVVGYGVFAAVVIPSALKAWRREALAPRWTRARSVAVGVALGAANFALAALYARWITARWGPPQSAMGEAMRSVTGSTKVALGLVAAVVGPVAEELFFRGWFQHAVKRDLPGGSVRGAVVLTALTFAVMHAGESWAPAVVAGLVTGVLMERSRRLEPGLAFHLVNNGLAVGAAMGLLRHWHL